MRRWCTVPYRLQEIEMRTIGETVAKVLVSWNAITGGFLVTLPHIGRRGKAEALAGALAYRLEENTFEELGNKLA